MALSPTSSRGGVGTVTGVTATDTSIVVAGTAAAPTLATGTLDVIATNHPPAADVALNAKKITGLGTPTLSTDAVTKAYTDAAINGLDWKQAARLASAAALPANTYVNGASGVGATLIGNAFGALAIDGVAVAVNDRVLLKTEGAGSHNGIYSVTATGGGAAFYVLTRTADYNTTAEIVAGTGLYVTEGTANADTSWVMTTIGAVTVGTTALTFTQFGGGGSSPVVTVAQYGAAAAGGTITIPSGVDTAGSWYAVPGFASLLDLTVPTAPTVLVSGYYTCVASIQFAGGTQVGKSAAVSVEADIDDWAAGVNVGPIALSPGADMSIPATFEWWMNAGTKVGWFVRHDVGSDQPWRIVAYLTRWTGVTAGSGTPPPP